ncbi:hypothetical protein MBT84_20760 [Streptomyces sp. MBT84]|nr:hypothetical protein [Streptomyces sp. MBT84]
MDGPGGRYPGWPTATAWREAVWASRVPGDDGPGGKPGRARSRSASGAAGGRAGSVEVAGQAEPLAAGPPAARGRGDRLHHTAHRQRLGPLRGRGPGGRPPAVPVRDRPRRGVRARPRLGHVLVFRPSRKCDVQRAGHGGDRGRGRGLPQPPAVPPRGEAAVGERYRHRRSARRAAEPAGAHRSAALRRPLRGRPDGCPDRRGPLRGARHPLWRALSDRRCVRQGDGRGQGGHGRSRDVPGGRPAGARPDRARGPAGAGPGPGGRAVGEPAPRRTVRHGPAGGIPPAGGTRSGSSTGGIPRLCCSSGTRCGTSSPAGPPCPWAWAP